MKYILILLLWLVFTSMVYSYNSGKTIEQVIRHIPESALLQFDE